MKWKFFKTNWFQIAVVILILAAMVKKNLLPTITNTGKGHNATEKLTGNSIASVEESRAGLFSWASRSTVALPDIPETVAIPFLQRFGRVAVGEQQKFGIPASVMLACAYVNSFSGQRDWAKQYHNYFALGCSSNWEGASENIGGVCVRKYEKAWDSFRDFSKNLSGRNDFTALQQSCGSDWKKWAKALDTQKVSDVSGFETEMTRVIEAYRLYELDK